MSGLGKVALVTGGGRGIGRGIALRLAGDGFDVAVADIDPDTSKNVAEEIEELGRKALPLTLDVSSRDEVHAAVDTTERALGGFDVMVNNAGICQVGPVADVKPEDVDRLFSINFEGVLWGIQAAAAKFRARQQRGKIINAASAAAQDGFPLLPIYSATKFAVRGLTQAAAREYASDGITVNAYCPGIVGTDMWVDVDRQFAAITGAAIGETYDRFVSGVALGRPETPEDVAGYVSFLAGPDSDYMTGQSVLIDGGLIYR